MTTYDMAAAYSAFVNDGIYIEPHTYTKVVDSKGNVLLEKKPKTNTAMSKKTAHMMCDMLHKVTQTGGTGVAAALPNVETAGKTGTTDDNKDRWCVGFTPYYVGAVWYGFDEPKNMSYLSNNPALVAWKKVMTEVHKDLPYKAFNKVSAKIEVEVCGETGMLYSSTCVNAEGKSTRKTKTVNYYDAPSVKCDSSNHLYAPENDDLNENEDDDEAEENTPTDDKEIVE